MVAMAGVVGTVVRSVGLSTAMRAAGVVTGMLPIPQPVLLVGPGSSARLGQAIAGFGHRNVLIVTDRGVAGLGLPGALVKALSAGGVRHVVFDDVSPDAPIPQIERGIAFYRERRCDAGWSATSGACARRSRSMRSRRRRARAPR
jgi:alcohol dehydrogenase